MEKETVECMCRIAGSLQKIREKLKSRSPDLYIEVKEEIFDSLNSMAVLCDAAPISLILGEAEEIMSNLKFVKEST